MKAQKKLMYALLGTALLSVSCMDSDKDYSQPQEPKEPAKTSELTVPDGFTWETTRNVELQLTSKTTTNAEVYLDEACTELVANVLIKANENNSFALELPNANDAIWTKYKNANGREVVTKVKIEKGTDTRAGHGTRWTASQMFPDDVTEIQYSDNYMAFKVYQPAKNQYGTIMFEDNWPELGDYDLNDFVINYNVAAEGKANANEIKITISLKLRAMGGKLPYQFCIRLGDAGFTSQLEYLNTDISDLEVTTSSAGTVKLLDARRAIFALTGFEYLRDEVNYYNVIPDHLISSTDQTPTVTFSFTLKHLYNNQPMDSYNLIKAVQNQFFFDYFIQNTKTKREIHFLQYHPTELAQNSDKAPTDKDYYCNKDGFVWALKAPVEMAWAIEKKDIMEVYPKFKSWVKQGGDVVAGDGYSPEAWYRQTELTKDKTIYVDPKLH